MILRGSCILVGSHLCSAEPPTPAARLCLINRPPPRRPAECAGAGVLDRRSLSPSSARIVCLSDWNHRRCSIRPSTSSLLLQSAAGPFDPVIPLISGENQTR